MQPGGVQIEISTNIGYFNAKLYRLNDSDTRVQDLSSNTLNHDHQTRYLIITYM